jgi:hypothetical protein
VSSELNEKSASKEDRFFRWRRGHCSRLTFPISLNRTKCQPSDFWSSRHAFGMQDSTSPLEDLLPLLKDSYDGA